MAILKRPAKSGKAHYQVLIDVDEIDPATGARKRRRRVVGTFRLKKDAEIAERAALEARDRGTMVDPSLVTVGELLDQCLATLRGMGKIREQTAVGYQITIDRHLKPAFGAIKVQKLASARVQVQYAEWEAGGMGTRTINEAHQRLSQALRYAQRHNIIAVNVCERVSAPTRTKPKPAVWTADEALAFLREAKGDDLYPVWCLMILEGLRRGEALGLRWQDVDLGSGAASIQQTVRAGIARGEAIIQPCAKTDAGSRSVRLTARTVEALKDHRTRQAERRLAAPEWADLDLITATSKGTPFGPANLRKRFDAIIDRAGVTRITPHGCRHTHATMLLKQGIHPKIVSERLGHTSVSFTLDRYSHILPDSQRTAADAIDALMAG